MQVLSQEAVPMPDQHSTDTTQGTVGGVAAEDEACLEGPTMQCTLEEERALLDPSLTQTLAMLNDAPLEYLSILSKHIEQIKSTKASQMQEAPPSPKAPLGFKLQPVGININANILIIPSTMVTTTLSMTIYTVASNLGHMMLLPQKI